MSNFAIKVENLGKLYQIGELENYYTLRDSLTNIVKYPFKLISNNHESKKKPEIEYIWALKDINFEVKHGEIIGIIGRNGAGKSTLLKILSRITTPTEGRALINGRVGSLLEVGTGFHPELTGRENIFLNGSILGMSKKEIERKFDEIANFSEIEKFLDTPVKRYSSGMYVRLAFAVAAHMEPEILIVDEVLAVGDIAFQNKCLGKLGDISKEGRTVLFVSHNLAAIKKLCDKGILLGNGKIVKIDKVDSVVNFYLDSINGINSNSVNNISNYSEYFLHKPIEIKEIEFLNDKLEKLNEIITGQKLVIRINYFVKEKIDKPAFMLCINDYMGIELIKLSTLPLSGYYIEALEQGKGYIDLHIDSLPLTAGRYTLDIGVSRPKIDWIINLKDYFSFEIELSDYYGHGTYLKSKKNGRFIINHNWNFSSK